MVSLSTHLFLLAFIRVWEAVLRMPTRPVFATICSLGSRRKKMTGASGTKSVGSRVQQEHASMRVDMKMDMMLDKRVEMRVVAGP